ncbi:MAG: 4Fe-4S binding protein, partial [Pseudomonadota bacterium]|nr:4Fe-4S binding protein [Pseudomonadota bacterium]
MTQRIPLQDLTSDAAVEHHSPQAKTTGRSPSTSGHIYVREIQGFFQRIRRYSNWLLIALYMGLPWLQWGDRPMVWFDLSAQEFHLFAATFYPQDFILLTWILVLCAFGLFLITVAAGRVWCGYSCPQSVWTFLFIWFEHRLEGPRHRRIRRDNASNTLGSLWRKGAKHTAWLLIALVTGVTFVGYFTPVGGLVRDLFSLEAHPWA